MGRAKETKRMRDEAKEARKSDRLRKAAEKFADEREHTAVVGNRKLTGFGGIFQNNVIGR